MSNKNVWFMNSADRGVDVGVARDEPSHIHIARPSRLLRRDNNSASSIVQPADQVPISPPAKSRCVPRDACGPTAGPARSQRTSWPSTAFGKQQSAAIVHLVADIDVLPYAQT